jgi:hypothetical protein
MDLKRLVTDIQPSRSDLEGRMVRELFLGDRGRLRQHIFELATAGAWMLTGITYLTSPNTAVHSSVGRPVHPFDTIWSILYVIGAVGTFIGVFRPLPALRVAGLTVLGTGLVMQTYAAASFALQPRVLAPAVYAVACFARSSMLTLLIRRSKRIYATYPVTPQHPDPDR